MYSANIAVFLRMISLEKLGYFLPQGFLFSDVSLQINRGDKIGLVGKNGAGKSTMLRLLTGQIQPSEGRIHLPKEMKIGMLSQDIKINTSKSVFEYLVTSNSTNLIKELRAYCWDTDKQGTRLNKPIDTNNHGIDALRYHEMETLGMNSNYGKYHIW